MLCLVHITDVVTLIRYDDNSHNSMFTDHTWVQGYRNVIEVGIQLFSLQGVKPITAFE